MTLREIENILYKFDGMKRVFIKKEFNKETKFYFYNIYAVLKDKYNISQLYDYIRKELNNIVVNNVEILDELPTTGTGKIKRNKLK
jgi:acyl-coenzyme A synthetase/AMP-(fatty) acid ligase